MILKVIRVEYAYKYIFFEKLEILVKLVSSNIRIFGKVLSGDFILLGFFSIFVFIELRYIKM